MSQQVDPEAMINLERTKCEEVVDECIEVPTYLGLDIAPVLGEARKRFGDALFAYRSATREQLPDAASTLAAATKWFLETIEDLLNQQSEGVVQ